MTLDLDAYLERRRRRIDEALEQGLAPSASPPAALHAAERYALLGPGKRLRGVLVLASCEMLGGDSAAALPLACAVEMVHASSLVLDDLPSMDNATLRRGKPPLYRVAGEATAILAAVSLLNGAFARVQNASAFRPRVRLAMAERLAAAVGADGLVGGQTADLESTGRSLDLETLEYIHSHKTGALFLAAAEIGALAAGAREGDRAALHGYAKNLGLAFQVTDDLLDATGSPETMGKDVRADRDRTTFVHLCGIDGSRKLADELIATALRALAPFGARAGALRGLAELVRTRDR